MATLAVDESLWPWIVRAVPSPLQYKWLRLHWVRARKAVGAGDIRLHDLRHLTAILLVNQGRPESTVQTTMRHATPAMTRRYAMQRDRGENAKALAVALLGESATSPKRTRKDEVPRSVPRSSKPRRRATA